jgi:hypothetical protein
VQYIAVITLAEIFAKEGDYAPSKRLYDKNPDLYIGLWKQWAKDTGRALAK